MCVVTVPIVMLESTVDNVKENLLWRTQSYFSRCFFLGGGEGGKCKCSMIDMFWTLRVNQPAALKFKMVGLE